MYRSAEFKEMEEIKRNQEVLYAEAQAKKREKKAAKRNRDRSGPREPSPPLAHASSPSFPTRSARRPSKRQASSQPLHSDFDSGSDPEWDPVMGD